MNAPRADLPLLRPGSAGKEFFLLIVLTVGLFLSITFIPVVGFLPGVLTPAPSVIAAIRWGFPNAWLVPACSAVFGSLILYLLNLPDSIAYLLALVGMGALMGYGFARQWPTEKIVGFSSLFVVGVAVLFAVLAFAETKGEMVRLIEQDLRGAISAALKQFGGTSPESREMESKLLETVPLIVRIMPGVLVSCTLAISWLNLLVSRRYCRAAAIESLVGEQLTLWKAPEFIVWFVIAGGLILLLPVGYLKLVAINSLVVLGTVYFLQGLAIIAFYLARWKLPFYVKGFVYAVLFLQQFASLATALLGLFDVWFDFRKMGKQPA